MPTLAEVRESARLFEGIDQTTAELRRLLDFLLRPPLADRRIKKAGAHRLRGNPIGRGAWAGIRTDAYRLSGQGSGQLSTPKGPVTDESSSWTGFQTLVEPKPGPLPDREGFLHWEVGLSRGVALLAKHPPGGRI